ncbi:hypothetical protein P280DRAFT_465452 [Massarina eburnea CBS 473.64]|uniref:Uncharacterized protein n=1 Tax=Massarina eburnea CBS 473.64 TaxID=1395130 RepID=A0A6A6SHD7_9PLEO|nr:hypothetical protein P280DRAFT_465452 [Massarina eburnea CBS 473.64]
MQLFHLFHGGVSTIRLAALLCLASPMIHSMPAGLSASQARPSPIAHRAPVAPRTVKSRPQPRPHSPSLCIA